jgi:arabinogalactan oligomer/maltooligosaccharide transport system permease protein
VLVVAALILAGALVVLATSRIGPRAATAGVAASTACLGPLAASWGGVSGGAAILFVAGLMAWWDHRGRVAAAATAFRRHRVAYAYLTPAALGMAVLVLAPFLVGTTLGFYDHHHGEWRYVGFDNFAKILSGDGRSFTDPLNFWFTLAVTVAWTAINVALHVTIGVALALALRERWMKARGLWRVLLILPWAIPNYITALIWRGMFQKQFGAVNSLLDAVGIGGVSWFSELATSFCANVVTNTWLGFPFMMVVALGALESIPRDLYEAAAVDGAGPWKRFTHITLPNLRSALMPAVVLGSVWTFNMFNVIYLVSGGRPAGSTDILVTQAYRWAFERGQRYGLAAAYATIIFLILVGWTLLAHRLGRDRTAESS